MIVLGRSEQAQNGVFVRARAESAARDTFVFPHHSLFEILTFR